MPGFDRSALDLTQAEDSREELRPLDGQIEELSGGALLIHQFTVSGDEPVQVLLQLMEIIRRHRAALLGSGLTTKDGTFKMWLELAGINGASARALVDEIARLPNVDSACLDRQIVRFTA